MTKEQEVQRKEAIAKAKVEMANKLNSNQIIKK